MCIIWFTILFLSDNYSDDTDYVQETTVQIDATEKKETYKDKVTIISSEQFAPENRAFLKTCNDLSKS